MTSRVFMIEPCRPELNVSSAETYGKIRHVFNKDESRPSIWTEEFVGEVIKRLDNAHFDPDVDYFIIAGSTVPVTTIACSIVAAYGHVKLLGFCASGRHYIPLEIGESV
jgi:hypothetical protein